MDIIFNLFKVRFYLMDKILVDNDILPSRDDRVNIFINIEPILRKLLTVNGDELSKVSRINIKDLTSNIINLAAHYRLFFSKNKTYSRIYLYIPTPLDSYANSTFIDSYRELYNHNMTKNTKYKNLSNAIRDSIDIVQLICEYIEGVYFIESGATENSLVPYIVNKDNNDNYKNFIVSSDPYDYQYVNYGFNVIVPKKDDSHIINKDNLIDHIKFKNRCNSQYNPNNNLFTFIHSLMGDQRRGIPRISRMGLSTILKTIDKAIVSNKITDNTFNINILLPIIKEEYINDILNNYYCTDIVSQYDRIHHCDSYFIIKQIKDKYDSDALKEVNNTYFSDTPIMLIEAMSGSSYKDTNDDIFSLRRS